MKKLVFFFSLLMFLTISTVQLWATETAATMTAGTNGSTCTVNGKGGIKVGTSKAGGDMTITVPSGATTLHLYAAAWKGVTGLSLNISGATVSPTSIALTADDGISNNSPFTLSGTESNFKFDIALSNITSEKTIQFTSSASKRFVVWGATYEVASSGDDPTPTPSLSVSSTTIDFGKVYQNASVENKTVEVTFANLTGSVTYSGLSSPFSATGTISSSGNSITIVANTSTIGEYSQSLTIQSSSDNLSKEVTVTMNVRAVPETGTFKLFSGDLVEGDYVFVVDSKAMTNTVSSNRLTNTDVAISGDNKITNPEETIIWHVAKSGDYWTIYNDAIAKYAAATGTKNQAVVTNTEDDKILWSVDESSGNYNFENKNNAANSVNAKLQRNGDYGWACYAAYSDIQLYKLDDGTPDAPTFSVASGSYLETKSVTISCATQGSTIYYTLDGSNPTNASTPYTSAISINESKTLKAIAIKDGVSSNVATAEYIIYTLEHAGTADDPYSVADAKTIIDVLGTKSGVYVSGIVSGIVEAYNSQYGNISFNISTNGTVNEQQIEAYRCKSFDGENFTSSDDVVNGATVVVYGNLKKFNSTYELDANCYLASYEAPEVPKTDISNTQSEAYTVAEALALASDQNSDLTKYVYIKGVVYNVQNFNTNNGTYDIYIRDANKTEEDGKFEFYRCAGIHENGVTTKFAEDDVRIGDEVIGYGLMAYYNDGSIWELKNDYLVELVRPTFAVTGIELDQTTLSIKEGETATLAATVAPANASNNSVTWSSSNEAIATVEDGVVTAVAIGSTTITVTTTDGGLTATCAVTVIDPNARSGALAVFRKVTSTAEISDGEYLIVCGEYNVVFDGGLETLDKVNNKFAVTIEDNVIVASEDLTFQIDIEETYATLKSFSGKYIGRTQSSNGLQSSSTPDFSNTFSIDGSGNAVIKSSSGPTLQYNKSAGQERFRYFASANQQPIQLYKKVEPTPVRSDLTAGKWGTICPQKKVLLPSGASFYTLTYKEIREDVPYRVFFDEIGEGESLEAGKPYLFIAEESAITGVEFGAAAASAQNYNGFHGIVGNEAYTLTVTQSESDAYKYYIIYQNQIRRCGVGDFIMAVGRAYIDMSEVSGNAAAPAPGRRRVSMDNPEAPQHYTGIETTQNNGKPAKMFINGQLFIFRNGQLYDTTGKFVK